MNRIYFLFIFFGFSQFIYGQCDTLQGEVKWRFWQDVPMYSWSIEDFYHFDRFPNGPDFNKTLYSLITPGNYSDYFGSQVRGYIRTDAGGQVVFNVNGDDEVFFNLSTDNTPDNLVLINGDTSDVANLDTITLVANQSYYFELNHFEIAGSDYASVEWKGDFLTGGLSTTDWTTVGGNFIYDVCESICDLRGTICDDLDATTTNDQYDGNCVCVGDPITANSCVGERGVLQTYLYKNMAGVNTNVLDDAITNGVQPDTIEELGEHFLATYFLTEGADSNYATYLQGFLSVPVTGLYSFNITGSHENHFYISSDDDPANKMTHHVWIPWWAGTYQHENPDYDMYSASHNQSEENILLEAGRYYYIELRHKGAENDWQNFNLYWKTPYQTRDSWLRIPSFYFFDYSCESVCVVNGVTCNDDDPYTANDQWDGNCVCLGTPCVVPDCDDPSTSYAPAEECETTNEVSNRADDAWLSCTPVADAPNPDRNGRHWIQYDFGALFDLGTTQIWNYNADGATNLGFEQVSIDYSTDGIYWEELTTTTWSQASGTSNYAGFAGPDFSGITARYVLISAEDGGAGCRGISKVAFNGVNCPNIQFSNPQINQTLLETTSISDVLINVTGGDTSINSVALFLDNTWIADDNSVPFNWTNVAALQNLPNGDYKLSAITTDANGTECELSTQIHAVTLDNFPCLAIALVIDTTEETVYRTQQTILSTGMVETNNSTFYIAEQSITLMPGFHAMAGSEFTAIIAVCMPPTLSEPVQSRITNLSNKQIGKHKVKLFPNPVVNELTIAINAHKAGILDIRVYDVLGKELRNLNRRKIITKGEEQLVLSVEALTAGLYYCRIKIGEETITKSFVRVNQK